MANNLINLFGALGLDSTLQAIRDRFPLSLGKKTAIGSLSVTLSSDGEQIAVSNFPATQAVTGTFYPATQPISATALPLPSGAATETTLNAVNTKLAGTLAVSGSFYPATQPVSATALPLPSGAATETTLAAVNTKLAGTLAVTGTFWQATQPVSAVSLPLPSGAATSAKQDSIITALGSPLQAGGSVSVSNLPIDPTTETTLQAILALHQQITTLNDSILYFCSAILEKMPRVTGNDQVAVSLEGGSVSTVTTVGTVTTVSQLGTRAAMTAADAQIMQGTSHIYSNISVA